MRRLTAILLALLSFCGCLSKGDAAHHIYVLSFGVESGDTFAYRIVLLAAMPKAGSEEGATLSTEVLAAEARTLFEAIETLNAGLPMTLRFSRTALILLSEPLAREGEIERLLDFSLGALDIHSNVHVMVAGSDLKTLYEGLQNDADPSFTKTINNLDALAAQSGTVPDGRCRSVWEALGSDAFDLVLPYIGANDPNPKPDLLGGEAYPKIGGALVQSDVLGASVIGSAVFDGPRMVGTLSGWHTALLAMVRGTFSEGRTTFYLPGTGTVSVKLQTNRRTEVSVRDGTAQVRIRLKAVPEYPLSALSRDPTLQTTLEQTIEAELNRLFSALSDAHADAMQFGTRELWQFPFGGEAGWKTRYASLSASFAVHVRVLETGGAS
ncbi:MAG: hypothetical protein IJK01_03230 [Clostridia bacterium]|nr:hypothetical protein [Clostridia bacterium]